MDVLEHLKSEREILDQISLCLLEDQGYVVVAVPAFPGLFSAHDEFMGHYRRYTQGCLNHLMTEHGFRRIASGYLFISLFIVRLLTTLINKIVHRPSKKCTGVGKWMMSQEITEF